MRRAIAAAVLTLVACSAARAHDGTQEGPPHSHWWLETGVSPSWYAGAGIGQARFEDYELFDDGSFTSQRTDDTRTALRLFGGLALGEHFAIELGYSDFGEASFRAQSDGSGTNWNAGTQSVEIEAQGYDVSLVGRLPLGEWAVFAKVGATWWESEVGVSVDAQCCGPIDEVFEDDGQKLTYGGGAQYDGWRPIRLAAEYGVLALEPEIFDDASLEWLALSVAYLF
jgi:hypothetical protein